MIKSLLYRMYWEFADLWQTLRGLNLEDKVFAVLYAATLFVVFFFAFRWVLWRVHDRVFGPFDDDGVDLKSPPTPQGGGFLSLARC